MLSGWPAGALAGEVTLFNDWIYSGEESRLQAANSRRNGTHRQGSRLNQRRPGCPTFECINDIRSGTRDA
jgi:hypothetical protein